MKSYDLKASWLIQIKSKSILVSVLCVRDMAPYLFCRVDPPKTNRQDSVGSRGFGSGGSSKASLHSSQNWLVRSCPRNYQIQLNTYIYFRGIGQVGEKASYMPIILSFSLYRSLVDSYGNECYTNRPLHLYII